MAQENNDTPSPGAPRRRSQLKTLDDVRRYMAEIIRAMRRQARVAGGINTQNGTLLVNALSKLAWVVQQLEKNESEIQIRELETELVAIRAEWHKFKAKMEARSK